MELITQASEAFQIVIRKLRDMRFDIIGHFPRLDTDHAGSKNRIGSQGITKRLHPKEVEPFRFHGLDVCPPLDRCFLGIADFQRLNELAGLGILGIYFSCDRLDIIKGNKATGLINKAGSCGSR